jgi:hypothetical protein
MCSLLPASKNNTPKADPWHAPGCRRQLRRDFCGIRRYWEAAVLCNGCLHSHYSRRSKLRQSLSWPTSTQFGEGKETQGPSGVLIVAQQSEQEGALQMLSYNDVWTIVNRWHIEMGVTRWRNLALLVCSQGSC